MARAGAVMRALLVLPFLLLAFVPTVAADAQPVPELPAAVECLLGPQIPETFGYYIVWGCTAGAAGVPEPVEKVTDCTVEFPMRLQCAASSPLDDADRAEDCVRSGRLNAGCVLGVQPDPVACLVNYALTQTPCR